MARPETSRPGLALALAVALVVAAGGVTLLLSATSADASTAPEVPGTLVEPRPGTNVVWPYTSKSRSVDGRTLPINVVVYGDAADLRFYLSEGVDATWNETTEEWQDIAPGREAEPGIHNGSVVEWVSAPGATRYTYLHDRGLTEPRADSTTRRPYRATPLLPQESNETRGTWIEETYQLHDGDYFGARDHIRVYESAYASDGWVVIQAHGEHWDWFRLRHTVDSTDQARNRIESTFMGRSYASDVWRMYLENGERADADGWATVVELRPRPGSARSGIGALAVLLAACSARRVARSSGAGREGDRAGDAENVPSRPTGRSTILDLFYRAGLEHYHLLAAFRWVSYAVLSGSLFVLYLSVRAGGILLERHAAPPTPKLVVLVLYPIVLLGLPACAYYFGRQLDPVQSFAFAAAGLGLAVVVDYSYLGVVLLPIDVVLHRVGIAVAVGLIAAGASPRGRGTPVVDRHFGAGVWLWVTLLVAPLVGWL